MWRIFVLFAGLASNYLLAQKEEVIVTLNVEEIAIKELLYAFNKNRNTAEAIQEENFNACVHQYINFKLNIQQAKAVDLDTIEAFRQ